MSEILLNVRDASRALYGTIHGSRADYVVAALSADPETIEELQAALARFLPPASRRDFFAGWRSGTRAEPWDAGVCIVDLAARLVVVQSTYSAPGPRGGVEVIGAEGREVVVPYHVADDWLFTHDLEGWQGLADERRRMRSAAPPLDVRAVLYGKVCEFIAQACWTTAAESSPATLGGAAVYQTLSAIHARWLTTPRDDLRGLAPRDVLLARRTHLNWDLQDRAQQWTLLRACPPGLSPETAAYRCGGYGTHEIVLYYELVRFLLGDCWRRRAETAPERLGPLTAEIARLEVVRDEWLATSNVGDLHGRTPASVIARERARLPEGVTGAEAMIDHDCPLCQMLAEDSNPMFWHLDGSNMDDDFAFSFHRTRAEWEAERRKWEDFNRRFEAEQAAKQAGAGESVWQRSFGDAGASGDSPSLLLFGLGAHLAELIQDLKDADAERALIDGLNRAYGNLREAAQDPTAALVEPVLERLVETLAGIAEAYPALAAKCADFERQLSGFGRRLVEEPYGDEELPF